MHLLSSSSEFGQAESLHREVRRRAPGSIVLEASSSLTFLLPGVRMMLRKLGSVRMISKVDDTDEAGVCMPPPSRSYTPGTPEYEDALRTGKIHCSICDFLSHKPAHLDGSSDCFVVSPNMKEHPKRNSVEAGNGDGAISSPSKSETYIADVAMESSNEENHSSSRISVTGSTRIDGMDYNGDEANSNDGGSDYHTETAVLEVCPVNASPGLEQLPDESSFDDPKRLSSSSSSCDTTEALEPTFEAIRFSDIVGHGNAKLRIDEVSCRVAPQG